MALSYDQNSWSIYTKLQVNGHHFCLPLYLPKTMNGLAETNTESSHASQKTLDKLAHEAEDTYRDTAKGELTEEEFIEKMRIIFRRLTRTLCTTPIVICFSVWLWERALRNRPDFRKVAVATRVLNNFLTMWTSDSRKPVTSLKTRHFTDYIWQRREDGYAPSTVNEEVLLLRSLGRDLKTKLGYDPAKELELERIVYGKRKAFTVKQLRKIIKFLRSQGPVGQEWKTLIMLIVYTSIRPGQACRLRRSAINISGKLKTITFYDSKGEKFITKPINAVLWKHLQVVLKKTAINPDDPLMPTLLHKQVQSRTAQFRRILEAVGISLTKTEAPYAKVRQYAECLYALRKTFNIWQYGISTKRQRQQRMNHATSTAHEHYEDDQDPYVIEQELRLLDLAPSII